MMNEKDFIESQKDCAAMLGMTLSEYQEYCKNTKVLEDSSNIEKNQIDNTNEFLNYLGISQSMLKKRKK